MSLKAFHLLFVTISTLLSLGMGVWAYREYRQSHETSTLLMSLASFVVAVLLIWYGRYFLRKLRNVSYL